MRLRDAVDNHPLLSKYMRCLTTADLIPAEYRASGISQPLRSGLKNMIKAWDTDEFVLDPSRITIYIGATGIDGDEFKRSHLMDRYGVQINKTSRNTVLFMTTIGTSRSSVAYLVEVLVTLARELDHQIIDMSMTERAAHERAVLRLTAPSAPLPDFSGFHPSFTRRPRAAHPGRGRATGLLPVLQRHLLRVPHAGRGGAAGGERPAGRIRELRHALSAWLSGAGAWPGVQPGDPVVHA